MSLRNLNPVAPIADADIPGTIARDEEITAAINAHVALSDPHSKYEFRAKLASKIILGPISFPANTWTSLGSFAGFPLGVQGAPSAVLVGIGFCFDVASPWQQACCAGILGPVWWQPASVADAGTWLFVEYHNATGFYLYVRAGKLSGDQRSIEIYPNSSISISSSGRVDVSLKKLL
jgi:hypothetical protein